MTARLLPCPGCDRHVRIAEASCPFCGAPLSSEMRNAGPAPLPSRRLGRAAKFAFGMAVAGSVAVTGCGDDSVPADTGTIGPAYGAVPIDAAPDGAADAGASDAMPDVADGPLYGGPPADGG